MEEKMPIELNKPSNISEKEEKDPNNETIAVAEEDPEVEELKRKIAQQMQINQMKKEKIERDVAQRREIDHQIMRIKKLLKKKRLEITEQEKMIKEKLEEKKKSLPPLEQINKEFLDSLDEELMRIPLQNMSLGDLQRMQNIFLENVERVQAYQIEMVKMQNSFGNCTSTAPKQCIASSASS